jgi:hypothetical protein
MKGLLPPDVTSCFVTRAQASHAHHKIPPSLIEIISPQDILMIQFSQPFISSYANSHELQKDFAF